MTTFPTRQAFQTWLETHEPDTIISEDWYCDNCPLANFTGYNISPQYGKYWQRLGATDFKLPKWAKAFGIEVDVWGAKTDRSITAAQCLNILKDIPND